jgi:hypothetical protein
MIINKGYPDDQQYAYKDYGNYADQSYVGGNETTVLDHNNQGYAAYDQSFVATEPTLQTDPSVLQRKLNRESMYSTKSGRSIERYCCGCFATKRGCITTCTLVWIVILGGLACAGFFLFPRVTLAGVNAYETPGKGY